MDKNAKVTCYKEMYARFKGDPDVKNLTYPKEKENLDFTFTIGEFKVLFSLKMETELFEVRGITYFPEKTDEEIEEIGACEAAKIQGLLHSEWDHQLIYMQKLPLVGMSDLAAKDKISAVVEVFVNFLKSQTDVRKDFKEYKATDRDTEETGPVEHMPERKPNEVLEGLKKEKAETMESRPINQRFGKGISQQNDAKTNSDASVIENNQRFGNPQNPVRDKQSMGSDDPSRMTPARRMPTVPVQLFEEAKENFDNGVAMEKEAVSSNHSIETSGNAKNKQKIGAERNLNEELSEYEVEIPESLSKWTSQKDAQKDKKEKNSLYWKGYSKGQTTDHEPEDKKESLDLSGKPGIENVDLQNTRKTTPADNQLEALFEDFEKTNEERKKQLDLREALLDKKSEQIKKEKEECEKALLDAENKKKIAEQKEESTKAEWLRIDERKKDQDETEKQLDERELAIADKEIECKKKEQSLNDRERSYKNKNELLAKQKKQNEENEKRLSEKEQSLGEREAKLSEKEEKLHNKKRELEINEKRQKLMEDQLEQKKDVIAKKEKNLHELEKMADSVVFNQEESEKSKEEKENLKRDLESAVHDAKELGTVLADIQEKHKKLILAYKGLNGTLAQKNNETEQMKSEIVASRNAIKIRDEQIMDLEKEMENMRAAEPSISDEWTKEKKSLEEQIGKLKETVKILESEKEILEKKLQDNEDNGNKTYDPAAMKELMEKAGYSVDVEPGESKYLLSGKKNDCIFYINGEAGVLCVKKTVKKKHWKEVAEWNDEDITESYSCSTNEVICRKILQNPVEDVRRITEKLGRLR